VPVVEVLKDTGARFDPRILHCPYCTTIATIAALVLVLVLPVLGGDGDNDQLFNQLQRVGVVVVFGQQPQMLVPENNHCFKKID
jgi:hypothetical protein